MARFPNPQHKEEELPPVLWWRRPLDGWTGIYLRTWQRMLRYIIPEYVKQIELDTYLRYHGDRWVKLDPGKNARVGRIVTAMIRRAHTMAQDECAKALQIAPEEMQRLVESEGWTVDVPPHLVTEIRTRLEHHDGIPDFLDGEPTP